MRRKHDTYLCEGCFRFVSIEEEAKKVCPLCGNRLKKSNKEISVSKLKKRTWQAFSDYIRLKKCLETTHKSASGICYTCGKTYPYKKLQTGHLVAGRADNVLFSEDCVELQCFQCNVCNHGEQARFVFHKIADLQKDGFSLEESYKKVQSLFRKRKKTYTKEQLAKLLKKYQTQKQLLERK